MQSPFMPFMRGSEWNVSESNLIIKINQQQRLMYYFTALNGLSTRIIVNEDWTASKN